MGFFSTAVVLAGRYLQNTVSDKARSTSVPEDTVKAVEHAVAAKPNAAVQELHDRARTAADVLRKGLQRLTDKAVNSAITTCRAIKETTGAVKNVVVDAAVNATNAAINKAGGAAASALTLNKGFESALVL